MNLQIIDTLAAPAADLIKLNDVIKLWKDVYTPILSAANLKLSIDSFQKARTVTVLNDDSGAVIGFALNNYINCSLLDMYQHSYFKDCPEIFKEELKIKKHHIMTIEFVTVNPNYQKRFSKVQYVDVLMGIQTQMMLTSNISAVMGYSRMDLKADKIAQKFGALSRGVVKMFDIDCSIIFLPRELVRPHPFAQTQELITKLYYKNNRKEEAA